MATSAQPIELGGKPVQVVVSERPLAADGVKLVVRGLRVVDRQPGVLYHLYLDLPDGKKPTKKDPRFVGSINFFNASPANVVNDRVFYTFDLSKTARTLRERRLLTDATTITFVPGGAPDPQAKAFVSRVELVFP
ncbi:MAG TPA: hypothetical protein VMU84_20065 [Thermoanaerobaculia bacterium]|nr:hypothetical protein [Thermoanaerobaculia bacterium]